MKLALTLNGNSFSASFTESEREHALNVLDLWLEHQPSAQEIEDLAEDVRTLKHDLQLTVNEHKE